MKPLGFLSLFLAAGLLAGLWVLPAAASLTDGQQKCTSAFTSKLKKIYDVDITKIEPEKFCAASEGAENNQAPEATQRKKLKLKKGEEIGTSYEGTCHASYEGIKLAYEKLAESRTQICQDMHNELNRKFPDCLSSKPADSCVKHIDDMAGIYANGKKLLADDIELAKKFLKDYITWNSRAQEKFQQDLSQLRNVLAVAGEEKLAAPVTPPEAQHQVDSVKQGSPTLREYLDKLERQRIRIAKISQSHAKNRFTSPIHELANATAMIEKFRDKLEDFKKSETKEFDSDFSAYREKLQRGQDKSTLGDGVKQFAPAAAPLASTFLGGGNNPAPVSSIGGGSTGALPALAIAGAAGMALGASSKSSGGSSLGGLDGPVMTPNNTADPTMFDGVKSAGGAAGDAAASPALPATDKVEADEDTASTPPLNSAAANGYGGGASSFPGGQKPKDPLRNPASPSTAGSDEALTPFAGELRPTPRPAAAAPDKTGNEVSALLGKMKDLFNLDENFGMDMPPPDYLGSGGPVSPVNSSTPTGGGGEEDYGSEYTGDEYEETYAGEDGEMQASNPLGNSDVTLFRRVHLRHFKCMEKGLVLLMQHELPE